MGCEDGLNIASQEILGAVICKCLNIERRRNACRSSELKLCNIKSGIQL